MECEMCHTHYLLIEDMIPGLNICVKCFDKMGEELIERTTARINELDARVEYYTDLYHKVDTWAQAQLIGLHIYIWVDEIMELNEYHWCKYCPSNEEDRFACSAGYTKEKCIEANEEHRYP